MVEIEIPLEKDIREFLRENGFFTTPKHGDELWVKDNGEVSEYIDLRNGEVTTYAYKEDKSKSASTHTKQTARKVVDMLDNEQSTLTEVTP